MEKTQQVGLRNQMGLPWLQAIMHFKFDLEIGAVLNLCYPRNCLNQREERDLCNLAFPESQIPVHSTDTALTDMHFTFRIRHKATNTQEQDRSLAFMAASQFNFSYGFVLFRKQKDPTSKRGWHQESFVLISELNLVCLFYRITEMLASVDYSALGAMEFTFEKMFEQSINNWLWPKPGDSITLQIKVAEQQHQIIVSLPDSMHQTLHPDQQAARQQRKSLTPIIDNPQTASNTLFKIVQDEDNAASNLKKNLMKTFFENTFRGIGDELKIQESFPGHLMLLMWNIWELVVTESPILVVGGDPRECSHAILTMLSLMHPLTASADYRPYLTILNSDTEVYMEMVKKGTIPNAILGVSSPLLTKNFGSFPAILRFDSTFFNDKKIENPKSVPLTPEIASSYEKAYKTACNSLQLKNYNLVLKPQPFVFQHLDFDSADSVTINDFNIRSHFKHLTKTFLEQFQDYWRVDPQFPELLKPFVEKEFLKSINNQNRFCRQFMSGKVDKCKLLCKKFVNTCLFHKYHNHMRKRALDLFLKT